MLCRVPDITIEAAFFKETTMAYKLLIVDDEKEVIANLTPVLVREGYEVEAAYDGEEAPAKIDSANPNIVLLDIQMPKLNGFQVLEKMKAKGDQHWRPVIIMSTLTELETMKKCYELEADHYLTKPFTVDDMLRSVRIMISLLSARIS